MAAPSSVARSAALLVGETDLRVSALIGDRVARAFLLEGDARALALDYNARLVTELRVLGVWPARYQDRCQG